MKGKRENGEREKGPGTLWVFSIFPFFQFPSRSGRFEPEAPRGRRPRRRILLPFTLLLLFSACDEGFDPPTLVTELRVLGIAGPLSDLLPGESTELEALVAEPAGTPIEYAWEWCPVDAGPDEAYRCLTEELGLPPESAALFDLGTAPTALLFYPDTAEDVQQLCLDVQSQLPELPDFIVLPDCDIGLEVTVRLTVRSGDLEKIAIKRIFLWFIDDPPAEQRNANPAIERIHAGGTIIDPELVMRAPPGGRLLFDVVVPEESMEEFLPREEDATELDREEILFSFFSTLGEWDRLRSFADGEDFSLAEAGLNALRLPKDAEIGEEVGIWFVVRDGRGGLDWTERRLIVTAPSGSQ